MPCLADALDLPTDAPTDASGAAITFPIGPTIVGYSAVFHVAGDPGTIGIGDDGEEVRVMPGAFDTALRRGGARALLEHREGKALGSMAGGTLRLSLDARGLLFALTLPPSELGRKVLRGVRSGRLTGASFRGSYTRSDTFTEDGRRVFEIHTSTLIEISLVRHPRFPGCGVCEATGSADADAINLWFAAVANLERADG